jgi:hypothetical protein
MSDLVERLRSLNPWHDLGWPEVLRGAATEIEALRRENQELRADCQRKDELLTAAVDDYNDARSLAIEECAKVAQKWKGHPADFHFAGRQIAAAIRALTMSDVHREQLDRPRMDGREAE